MKGVLIGAAVVAVALGGAFAVYKYQQSQGPKDPAQVKQAPAPMPPRVQPVNFAQQPLAYAPGASPTLTQLGQGLQLGASALDLAKGLGLFGDGTDESDDA